MRQNRRSSTRGSRDHEHLDCQLALDDGCVLQADREEAQNHAGVATLPQRLCKKQFLARDGILG